MELRVPLEMFAHGVARAGFSAGSCPRRSRLRLPHGRLAHHPALRRRGRRAPLRRPGADAQPQPDQPLRRPDARRWPFRLDTATLVGSWFQDPAGDSWHALEWSTPTPWACCSAARRWTTPASSRRLPTGSPSTAGALVEPPEQWGGRSGGRGPGRAADGAAAVGAAAAPCPGPAAGSRRALPRALPRGRGRWRRRRRQAGPPVPRGMSRAISTWTRWRRCEHAAAARRAGLLAVHPAGWEQFVTAPPRTRPRPADRRAGRGLPAGAGWSTRSSGRSAAPNLARCAPPADARRARAAGRHR